MARVGELKTFEMKVQPMPFKFVIGNCWRNVSYKKAIRRTKKRLRKLLLKSVEQWESATGYSRYNAYFQRTGHIIIFSIVPVPQSEPVEVKWSAK